MLEDAYRDELISVIIPVYNGEAFIRCAIFSAFNQTYPEVEVIVVDDGSSDGTLACVKAIEDPRLRVLHQANTGVSAARNAGAASARGGLIAFLDADDIWFPEFLESACRALSQANNAHGFAFGSYYCVDENRRFMRMYPCRQPEHGIAHDVLLEEGLLLNSISVMHRRVFEEIGGFPRTLRHHEDRAFYVTLATQFDGCYTGKRLTIYRQSQQGKARSVLNEPERAMQAAEDLAEAVSAVLPHGDRDRFTATTRIGLFCRFAMYGHLRAARQMLDRIDRGLLRRRLKGVLALLAVRTHLNILSRARQLQQMAFALALRPWWSRKSQPAYAAADAVTGAPPGGGS